MSACFCASPYCAKFGCQIQANIGATLPVSTTQTIPVGSIKFTTPAVTEERIRQIIREELARGRP